MVSKNTAPALVALISVNTENARPRQLVVDTALGSLRNFEQDKDCDCEPAGESAEAKIEGSSNPPAYIVGHSTGEPTRRSQSDG